MDIYCPECQSGQVRHEVDRDDEGEPTNAWFECASCGFQWSDYELSNQLLEL
jgi:transposase-like protein